MDDIREEIAAVIRSVLEEQQRPRLAMNVKEAAHYLGLAEKTVYTLTHRVDFPALRVGNRILIPTDKLREWLEAHTGEVLEV